MNPSEKLEPLKEIASLLNHHRIHWCLGGSALLYFHNLVEDFRDIDLLVTEKGALDAIALLRDVASEIPPPTDLLCHSRFFHTFCFKGLAIDLIAGFSLYTPDGNFLYHFDHDTPLECISLAGEILYLGSLEDWLSAYHLMGRRDKTDLLSHHLRRDALPLSPRFHQKK